MYFVRHSRAALAGVAGGGREPGGDPRRRKVIMHGSKAKAIVLSILLILFAATGAPAAEESRGSFSFSHLKKTSPSKIEEYSGKPVAWKGTLKELVSNDAYFEYIFTLPSGDEIKALSGRGLKFREGDFLELKGFVMIRDGRFSHVVINDATRAEKPRPEVIAEDLPGLFPLDASNEEIYKRIYSWILYYNPGISRNNASFIANRIVHYSRASGIDPFLVTAVMSAESAFNIYARSVAGAIGLGQLMPGTAQALGVNAHDPDQNIAGSVRYLKHQMNRWSGSTAPMALALASYNAGPGAVEKYGGIPPFRETIDYVNIVSSLYYQIRKK